MELPEKISEARVEAKFAYLGFMDTVYQMPLWQRWVLVGSLVVIMFGFWALKLGTTWLLGQYYKSASTLAQDSFANPSALTVGLTGVVPLSDGGVLAYGEIANPNLSLSARTVGYSFLLQDKDGVTLGSVGGQTFLLPGQSRLVASSRVTTFGLPVRAKLVVNSATFQKRLSLPEVDLRVTETKVQGFGQDRRLEGRVINNSAYTLGSVELVVRLDRRSSGELVAVFARQENMVVPRVPRAFVIPWPDLPEEDVKVTVEAYTNVLDAKNLLLDKSSSGGLR